MGRYPKTSLNYRPLNIGFDTTEKLIRHECGSLRMAILIALVSKIYGDMGYFTKFDESALKLFTSDEQFKERDVRLVLNSALKYGYFDKELYKCYNILTSKDIQEVYLLCCAKRRVIDLTLEYLCVNLNSYTEKFKNKLTVSTLDSIPVEVDDICFIERNGRVCAMLSTDRETNLQTANTTK